MTSSNPHLERVRQSSVLLTGGAGFIGSHILDELLELGCRKVRLLDNLSTGKLSNIRHHLSSPHVEWLEGDIRDLSTCQNAVQGMDLVCHQAALGSVPRSLADPMTTHQVNIDGFVNILESARSEGIQRVVYAASSSTYGDHPALPKKEEQIGKPLSPYAVTKLVNELYADVYANVFGFASIGLRYFNVFGPRQDPQGPYAAVIPVFIQAALQGKAPFINGDGLNSRDFTYVANAVQANIKALFWPDYSGHQVLNIAVGESCTLNQLWEYITAECGVHLAAHYREPRKGDVLHSLASITKAQKVLGYQPTHDWKKGIALTIEWFRKNGD